MPYLKSEKCMMSPFKTVNYSLNKYNTKIFCGKHRKNPIYYMKRKIQIAEKT